MKRFIPVFMVFFAWAWVCANMDLAVSATLLPLAMILIALSGYNMVRES